MSVLSVDIGLKHMALCHKIPNDPKFHMYLFSVSEFASEYDKIL